MVDQTIQQLPLDSNILKAADERIKSSANQLLYIVRVEDPTVKEKQLYYVWMGKFKIDNPMYIEIVGFSVPKNVQSEFSDSSTALEYAKSNKIAFTSKLIPWHRILEIENRTSKPELK